MNPTETRYSTAGAAQGLAADVNQPKRLPARISVVDFTRTTSVEKSDVTMDEIHTLVNGEDITWVHVQGQPTSRLLDTLAVEYGFHTLALEDVVNVRQRSKFEIYEDACFIVMQLPVIDEMKITLEQVSIFLGKNYLISFHPGERDVFDSVRAHLRKERIGHIRTRGADYLLYALLDQIVDLGFPVLDALGDRIEDLEERVLSDASLDVQVEIHDARRTINNLRHGLAPQRDVLNILIRDDHPFVHKQTKIYLRDCHDHMIRIIERLESYRELVLGVQEIYMSSLNTRMNEVMKVLTIIATIFIPLSFVTGLYGMNFDPSASPWNMPELRAYYGYPMILVFIAVSIAGMLVYFKRRGWL